MGADDNAEREKELEGGMAREGMGRRDEWRERGKGRMGAWAEGEGQREDTWGGRQG
jgi:hypothetical protein